MLYVLINHNYHLQTLRQHGVATLGGSTGVTLITVPHTLSSGLDTSDFHAVHRFDTPVARSRMPFLLGRYGAQARAVTRTLQPGPGDTLLFFTEVEWLNQIIAQHFHKRGARVIMMEDGGFATYLQMSAPDSEPLSVRERCIQAAYRLVPGLAHSRLFKFNGVLFPRLPDAAIDMIALYQDVPLQRRVQIRRVRPPARKSCDVRPSTVVFLNQPMYSYYQTADAYLAGLRRLMVALVNGFENVHFKFHPRETGKWKRRIRAFLAQEFPGIDIIDRSGTMEDVILDYRPEVLASYFSAGVLSLEYEGIEPLYLYHLLDDLKDQPAFAGASGILRSWGYCFVGSDDEARSGYRSGIMAGGTAPGIDLRQLLLPSGT